MIRLLHALLVFVFLFSTSIVLLGQSKEGRIKLEFQDYYSKEELGQVEGEGAMLDGVPHGKWEYFLVYNHKIKYYSGHYSNGKKYGKWYNYATSPPLGYTDNFDFRRSTESWKDNKLYRFMMGHDKLQITIDDGLTEPHITELRRLDEAFDDSYRNTQRNNITAGYGESVESMLSRLIPMVRQELLKSGQKSDLKNWTEYNLLKLHEHYDSGVVQSSFVQNWIKTTLYSTELYYKGKLAEKYIFLDGDPSNYIEYLYSEWGAMIHMRQYVNDTIPAGRWIENYPNGDQKSRGSYSDGKRNGKWKFWSEDGIQEIVKYKDGIKQE